MKSRHRWQGGRGNNAREIIYRMLFGGGVVAESDADFGNKMSSGESSPALFEPKCHALIGVDHQ